MSDSLPPPVPRRLVNAFATSQEPIEKTYFTIPQSIYNYFFRHVLAGRRGGPQNLSSFFFKKLYDECKRRGIAQIWDDTNEQRIADILNDLNFNPPPPPKPIGGARGRRTPRSPDEPKG